MSRALTRLSLRETSTRSIAMRSLISSCGMTRPIRRKPHRLTIAAAFALVSAAAGAHTDDTTWITGVWTATSDEDGTPADVFEFTSTGKYVNYGFNCSVASTMTYHVFSGDIYVTAEVRGKGPIAIVFRPSPDHRKLTFTSPRSRHNAVYERLAVNPCLKPG